MTALVQSASKSAILPVLTALGLGLGILSVAGHVQAAALHDSAHDVRHATGFPCH
ncbi:CbtB domain-containing protein [Roseovarius salis]|uniref:CbtB domain-containing protein n=1 Tax=Roseovarius salis TaxID=3376063 RepID=UPI0037C5DE07